MPAKGERLHTLRGIWRRTCYKPRHVSSLRLVHSNNDPTGEELTGPSGESTAVSQRSLRSTRLQSMVDKLYRLEHSDSNSLHVFDQLIDDLLAEARGAEKPEGGEQ